MNVTQNFMRIVIVGHVDHGKSTLIGRLFFDTNSLPDGVIDEVKKTCEMLGKDIEFAYVLDSLAEEREQNVTIDTTQTWFSTDKRNYIIIDAPGHKEFLKNMITGASQADTGVLIVSAKEGVEEQTKRHAYILGMLGLKQVMVVINKMDAVVYDPVRFETVKNDITAFLGTVGITPKQVIPISAKEGDNVARRTEKMSWYTGPTILEALDLFENKTAQEIKPLRFPVQDVYKIDDKRILVGRVESGGLTVGDAVTFSPSGKTSTIKSVEVFLAEKSKASAGESIGVTIEHPLFIERGEVITKDTPTVTNTINAKIFWMDKQTFNTNEKLTLKCATQEVGCRIEKIAKRINSSDLTVIQENATELQDTEVGEVVIKTDEPIVVENFNTIEELGRFVLVRGNDVTAGGIIV
jgi:sulfate adenylyltransferase large subunit